jgi:transposase
MWTKENRICYNRDKLRHPSDLIDAEWSLIEPLIPPAKRGGNKRRVNLREIVNGIMYVLSTGCQWRAYLDLWIYDGTLDRMHHALYEACREQAGREASSTACIIDSQSVKSAEKGGAHRSTWVRRGQTDQGQEATHPRRHRGIAAACHRACRRHSRSRRRRSIAGHAIWPVSVFEEAVRRQRLPRPDLSQGRWQNSNRTRHRNRQTFRSGQGFRRPAKALDRRTNDCLAQSVSQACQGLGKSECQSACVLALCLYPSHVTKTL